GGARRCRPREARSELVAAGIVGPGTRNRVAEVPGATLEGAFLDSRRVALRVLAVVAGQLVILAPAGVFRHVLSPVVGWPRAPGPNADRRARVRCPAQGRGAVRPRRPGRAAARPQAPAHAGSATGWVPIPA